MRALIGLLLTAIATLAVLPVAKAESGTGELIFGIYPFLSPRQIADRFSPLRDHLAKQLERPVSLRSAPDFESFIERTRKGEYDIAFTAPHIGRLAEQREGYRVLTQTGYSIVIVLLARKDGPIRKLTDLKGHSLAVGARLSMSYQMVNRALESEGLAIGRDVRFVDTTNFSNVFETLIRQEADAGATGTLLWNSAPAEKHNVLREIWRSQAVPGFLILAHPRLGSETLDRLKQSLLDFGSTPAGRDYFQGTQQVDFRPIDAATLKRIDPYTAVLGKH